jgi:ubiquinone biosynthesis protein UbiJ
VLSLGACGGPIQSDELGRGIESLKATAQEGRLLAQEVARDHTKSTFVRVHSRALADSADHEAEKLHDAEARGTIASVKAGAVRLAQDVSSALGDLQVAPGDEAVGAQVAGQLRSLAADADRLGSRL